MNAERIAALIERVEAAEGPERWLFVEAFARVFPSHYMEGRSGIGPHRWDRFKTCINAEAWTDAALTLLPEGWIVGSLWNGPDKPGCILGRGSVAVGGEAATMALALVAACLRTKLGEEE